MEISAAELKSKLEKGEPVEVLDIRESDEFASWHIEGSRNLPVYESLKRNDDEPLARQSASLPRDRSIVTVCRGGVVSHKAAELLRSQGYEASSLAGGMRGWGAVWSEAPVPISAPRGATFLQIRRNGKGCLSYLLGSDGRAAVVDPSADVAAYLEAAERSGLEITHVLETHLHADHLSRARELCRITGALLVLPKNLRATYAYTPIRDGETISVGRMTLEAIHTPGHTSESTCYLVGGEILLSGDTLFVNGVGRPDLEQGDAGAADGARALHRSLHQRLFGRSEDLHVYPGHHAKPLGFDRAAVGARLGDVIAATELARVDENAFVDSVLASLGARPGNHETILAVNEGKRDLAGADPLDLEAGPNRCAVG